MFIKPCYIDIHIHTSEDANHLNEHYDVIELINKVNKISQSNNYLISLTDHNTINKKAYENLNSINASFIVGVEVHIRNYKECPPYHCHLFFDIDKTKLSESIDKINNILNVLYPNKLPESSDTSIPQIQTILDAFDEFEYLVLPHGGQSHSTFNDSIPKKTVKFDTVLQRSIYYNIFDGFTSRTNHGLEDTIDYFKRLNINEFINLISCSDNYSSSNYPKGKDGTEHIKTWMYSEPTFAGFRLALSEKERLEYGDKPSDLFQQNINKVYLDKPNIKIDVELAPGLNAVIGNSSSGKTLFVDSVYKKLKNISETNYSQFEVADIYVENSSNIIPHYFSQNYILDSVINVIKECGSCNLSKVSILNDVFKLSETDVQNINKNLKDLEDTITNFLNSSVAINEAIESINKLPHFVDCVSFSANNANPISSFAPSNDLINKMTFSEATYNLFVENLQQIKLYFNTNPLLKSIDSDIDNLLSKIDSAYQICNYEFKARNIITKTIKAIDLENSDQSSKEKTAIINKASLMVLLSKVKKNLDVFYENLEKLSTFSFSIKGNEIDVSGHKLFINNDLIITKDTIVDTFNEYLKKEAKIKNFDEISPSLFVTQNYNSKKVADTNTLKEKFVSDFRSLNKVKYKILYKGTKEFDSLSPGIQSSVILDIILGYSEDKAPLIIDQPEDNLSTTYINGGLVDKIKHSKKERQIIIVTHNATIPMLGDAQNVVLCLNEDGNIEITSHKLEEIYKGKTMTDWIAELTDGGKASIKKRFKKYHLKDYKEI